MKFWTRRDGLCFCVTFAVALTVYVYSLPPSITLEDAGELAVAADHLGIPIHRAIRFGPFLPGSSN